MSSKLILALAAGLVAAAPLQGQRVVPVEEEPFHRTVLLAPVARILDIRLLPGDSTAFHSHSRPYFWTVVTGHGFDTQAPGATGTTSVAFVPGHVGFTAATPTTALVHRVFNRSSEEIHLISGEVDPGYTARCGGRAAAPAPAGAELVHDTLGITVHRVRLGAGEQIAGARGAQLWVAVTPATLARTPTGASAGAAAPVKRGEWLWDDGGAALRNAGGERADGVLVRWRDCAPA